MEWETLPGKMNYSIEIDLFYVCTSVVSCISSRGIAELQFLTYVPIFLIKISINWTRDSKHQYRLPYGRINNWAHTYTRRYSSSLQSPPMNDLFVENSVYSPKIYSSSLKTKNKKCFQGRIGRSFWRLRKKSNSATQKP